VLLRRCDGLLSAIYQRQYISSSQRFPSAPRLSAAAQCALDVFDSLADSPSLHMSYCMQQGDLQLVHNHNMLHDRSAFYDGDDGDVVTRRHLLRAWIAPLAGATTITS